MWEPALGTAKASGRCWSARRKVGKWGAPTYDLDCAQGLCREARSFSPSLSKVTGAAYAKYNADPKATPPTAPMWTKSPADRRQAAGRGALAGQQHLSVAQAGRAAGQPFAEAVGKTPREFLRAQAKVEQVQIVLPAVCHLALCQRRAEVRSPP